MEYILMTLGAITLVFAVLACGSKFSSLTGGHPRTSYWGNIFGGIAWLSLGLAGLLSAPYVDSKFVPVLSVGIGALGALLLALGLKARSAAISRKS